MKEARHELIATLAAVGYEHRVSDTLEGRLYFKRDSGDGCGTHQASVCVPGLRFRREHLEFRHALRLDVDLARSNELLKYRLAAILSCGRMAHSAANDDFVAAALAG